MKKIFIILSLFVCFFFSTYTCLGKEIKVQEIHNGYLISHPEYSLRFEYTTEEKIYFIPNGKEDYCVFKGIQTYKYPEGEMLWNPQTRKIEEEKVIKFSLPMNRKVEKEAKIIRVIEEYADETNKIKIKRSWIIDEDKPYFITGHSVSNQEEKTKGLYMVRTPFTMLLDYDGGTTLYPQGLKPLGGPSYHGCGLMFHNYFFCPIAPYGQWPDGIGSEPPLQVCWKKDTGEGMIGFIPYDAMGMVKLDREGEYSAAFYVPDKKIEINSFLNGDGISSYFQAGFAYLNKSTFFDGFNFYCKHFPEFSSPALEKVRELFPGLGLSGPGVKLIDKDDFLRAVKEANFKFIGCGDDDPGRAWGPHVGPEDVKELAGPVFEKEYGERIRKLKRYGFKVGGNSAFSIGMPLLIANKELKAPGRFGLVNVPDGLKLNFSDSLVRDKDGNLRLDWGRCLRPNYLLKNSWSQFVFNNIKSLIEKYHYDFFNWEDHTGGIDFSQGYKYLPFTPIETGYSQMISSLGRLCHEYGIPFGRTAGGLHRWIDAGAEDGGMFYSSRGWTLQFFLPGKVRSIPGGVIDGNPVMENIIEKTKAFTLGGAAGSYGIWYENYKELLFWRDYFSVQNPFVTEMCSAYPFKGDPENPYQDRGISKVIYHRTSSGPVVITAYNSNKLIKEYTFPLSKEEMPEGDKYVVIEWSFEKERSGYLQITKD